jgi:hypothetical protein
VRAQLVHRDDVVGVRQRNDEFFRLPVERHREHAVAARQLPRQHLQGRRVHDDVRQIDRLQPELLGQRVAQRRLGHETELDQQPPHGQMRLHLLEQRYPQLVLGEDALVDQNLPDVALGLGRRGRVHPASMIPAGPGCRTAIPGMPPSPTAKGC